MDRTESKIDTPLTQPRSGVVRGEGAKAWVVYDAMLRPWGPFDSAKAAADWARETWPGADDWEVQPLWRLARMSMRRDTRAGAEPLNPKPQSPSMAGDEGGRTAGSIPATGASGERCRCDLPIEQCPTCGADCVLDDGIPMPVCHCGKDGHALYSVNCPVHGNLSREEAEEIVWDFLTAVSDADQFPLKRTYQEEKEAFRQRLLEALQHAPRSIFALTTPLREEP